MCSVGQLSGALRGLHCGHLLFVGPRVTKGLSRFSCWHCTICIPCIGSTLCVKRDFGAVPHEHGIHDFFCK